MNLKNKLAYVAITALCVSTLAFKSGAKDPADPLYGKTASGAWIAVGDRTYDQDGLEENSYRCVSADQVCTAHFNSQPAPSVQGPANPADIDRDNGEFVLNN